MEYLINVEQSVKIFVNDINPKGKKTMLFIHGWPANNKMFEYQYNEFIQLGYRCIGIDVRGFGNSDKPTWGYDYNRLADDLMCVVKALRLSEFTLVGHSTGGSIAIRYMSRHRGAGVSKLALCAAAAPSLIQRPNFPFGTTAADIEETIKATYEDRPNMLRNFGEKFFYSKVSAAFSDWFFLLGMEAASWSTVAISKSWIAEELFEDLGKIRVPTVILHGVHDQVCFFPLAIAQHEGIKNSQLIPFENSGHGLFYDELGKFNNELLSFVEK